MDYLSLNPHQRSFEVDNDKDSKGQLAKAQRLREVRMPSPKWNLYINPIFQRLRDHFRRTALETYGPKKVYNCKETHSEHSTEDIHLNLQCTVSMHNTCSSANKTKSSMETEFRHQFQMN